MFGLGCGRFGGRFFGLLGLLLFAALFLLAGGLLLAVAGAGGIRGKALLKGLVHLRDVGKAHGLGLLSGLLGGKRRFVGDDGRDDEIVAHGVALHILLQLLAQLIGGLIAVFGVEGAGFLDDLGKLIVRIQRRRQLLPLQAAVLCGFGAGLLVFKGGVAAVVDAVEQHAHGIQVDGRVEAA